MAKPRDFLSLEQALLHALKDLTDDDLKTTKRKREEARICQRSGAISGNFPLFIPDIGSFR